MIYLHSTSERQRTIASAINERAQAELQKTADGDGSTGQSGTDVAQDNRRTA